MTVIPPGSAETISGSSLNEFPPEDVSAELSFVICERRATISSIRRERKESEKIKGIRIAISEKMIRRTEVARAMVEAYPGMLRALREAEEGLSEFACQAPGVPCCRATIFDRRGNCLGQSGDGLCGEAASIALTHVKSAIAKALGREAASPAIASSDRLADQS